METGQWLRDIERLLLAMVMFLVNTKLTRKNPSKEALTWTSGMKDILKWDEGQTDY